VFAGEGGIGTMNDQPPTSTALFTAMADSAPIAMYYHSSPGLPLYTNPAFREMFGVEASENFEVWLAQIHPEDRSRVQADWAAFEARWDCKGEFRAQYRVLDSTGSVRVMLERVVPAVGVSGFIGTITDVTQLVQTQLALERTHDALVSASRQAGMAEVATSVLHNVGNALNSVNVSANLLETYLRQPRIARLGRIAAILVEQADELPAFMESERGRALPRYLTQLSSQLLEDQEAGLRELASLLNNLEHIKTIVRMQQSYASRQSVAELVSAAELVDDGVRMNAAAFDRHGVMLKLDFEDTPPLTVDKHKVLQILVNLISNAKNACEDSGRSDKCITIRIRATPVGVSIAVIDNGVGIPPENMTKIFTHGFTSRPEGHGFGLHSAALAARELQGSLHAASEGPGCGATFTLELPGKLADRS